MRDTDYTSLRREFLGVGLTGAMVGLAGCSDSVTVETGSDDDDTEESTNQSPDLASVELSFSYSAAEQQMTIEFVGGADIKAGNVRLQQGSETQVSWAELGSTTSNPDQNISPGATAVLGENILNWGQPVAEDDLIRVVYTGGETPATLERYSPPESTDSESTVPASISGFTLENSGEQQLEVSFDSSKQLRTINVEITEAESATLARSDFTETASGDGEFTYSASYDASSDGSYTAEITQAADADGANALNGENISDTASINTEEQPSDTTPPSISAFSIANPSEQQLRVSFESNEQLSTIQINITGAESVVFTMSDFSESETENDMFSYEALYSAESAGNYTATLTEAVDSAGNDGATEAEVSVTIPRELSAEPEFRLNDNLSQSLTNDGVGRQSNNAAVGDYAWDFDGESHILTEYVWERVDQSGTLCAWVYIPSEETNNESSRDILGSHDGGSYADFNGEILTLSQSGNGDGVGIFRRTQENKIAVRTTDFPTGEWFHLAGVIDAQNEVRVYVNGELRDSSSDIEFDDMEQEPVFAIGAQYRQRGSSSHDIRNHFVGQLDDVQLFESVLTAEEIDTLVARK